MEWELVKIENNKKGRGTPYASVGFGRLSLSAAACELLDNFDKYSFVELLKGKKNNKMCIGVRFLKESERTQDSLPIKRKNVDGKVVKGADIANKKIMEDLFGINGSANKSTRFAVEKDKDMDNILVVFAE